MSNLIYVPESLSTQDEIEVVLLQNDFTFVGMYTFNQTQGKGQYGNVWQSSENLNIAYSLALGCENIHFPKILFNYHTAVVIRNFLAKLTQNNVKIKWPNDIIIQQKKVAGILIEIKKIYKKEFYIIGIGLNVLQTDFGKLPKAGSLLTQTRQSFHLKETAQELHHYLTESFEKPASELDILKNFNQNLFRKNEISVFEINGLRQNGIIERADEKGFLWVNLENEGLRKFFHKEIELLY